MGIGFICGGCFVCHWCRERRRMSARLSTFTVEDGRCFLEKDKKNILFFIRQIWASHTQEGETGIGAFNSFVQGRLCEILMHTTFPWRKSVFRVLGPTLVFSVWFYIPMI